MGKSLWDVTFITYKWKIRVKPYWTITSHIIKFIFKQKSWLFLKIIFICIVHATSLNTWRLRLQRRELLLPRLFASNAPSLLNFIQNIWTSFTFTENLKQFRLSLYFVFSVHYIVEHSCPHKPKLYSHRVSAAASMRALTGMNQCSPVKPIIHTKHQQWR